MIWVAQCLSLAVVSATAQAAAAQVADTLVYVGTQGGAILGGLLAIGTGRLSLLGPVGQIEQPTWLAVDPNRPILYSVSETGNDGKASGGVYSFAIDPVTGMLKVISTVESGGGGATYLSYDPRVKTVFVANYGGGQVAASPVGADGSLSPASSILRDSGTGPSPKQNIPHAHGATLDPGSQFVLTPDMGADGIFIRRFDARSRTLSPADPPFVSMGPGTGPHHLVFSPDGRFLYPSSWTLRTLHVYAVDRSAGNLNPLQVISTGGKVPRSFGIDPSGRWMIVGNQISRTLTVFRIDEITGRLTATGQPLPVELKRVAFTFYPR